MQPWRSGATSGTPTETNSFFLADAMGLTSFQRQLHALRISGPLRDFLQQLFQEQPEARELGKARCFWWLHTAHCGGYTLRIVWRRRLCKIRCDISFDDNKVAGVRVQWLPTFLFGFPLSDPDDTPRVFANPDPQDPAILRAILYNIAC
jgi:hypothetical protein